MSRILNKLPLVVVAVIILLCLTGCKSEEEVKLRVLLKEPYETSLGTPEEDSVEMELVRRLAKEVGMDYELVYAEEDRSAESVLMAGEADVALGNIVESEALRDNFICSVSYATRPLYIVTVRGDYRNIPEVFMSVGLSSELNDSTLARVKTLNKPAWRTFSTRKTVISSLRDGTIGAYFCYEQEAFELAKEDGLQAQDAVGVNADRFVIIAPKNGLNVNKDILDYLVLSYLAEHGEGVMS